jgi:hypothetical protein
MRGGFGGGRGGNRGGGRSERIDYSKFINKPEKGDKEIKIKVVEVKHKFADFKFDEMIMKNPNLYIELEESEQNGYLLQEDGRLLLTQNNNELFY